jgi:DNA-binding transcriptional LysR family regulator
MARIGDRGEMEAFVRAVELGGFSAAAREMKLSPSALSKMVDRLERSLSVRLLTRTTRRLAPTAEGELFLARCRRILAEIEDAETEVGRSRERPRGRLAMHVGVGFAMHQVVDAMPRFLRRYPDVQLDLRIEDARLDLVKENVDISVRPAPADESLVVRKLFDFDRIVCAAPSYIKANGAPRRPEELAQHRCLAISGTFGYARWNFDGPGGRHSIPIQPATRVNNADCIYRFALMGMGIVRLNEFMCASAIRAGHLVPLMRDYPCTDSTEMIALYPHERNRLPRVAAMLDFLVETFGPRPWRVRRKTAKAVTTR